MSVLSNRHRHTRVFVHEESYTHTHTRLSIPGHWLPDLFLTLGFPVLLCLH